MRLEGLRKRPLDLFRHLTDVMGMQCATDEAVDVAPPATTTTALSSADMARVRAGLDLDVEKDFEHNERIQRPPPAEPLCLCFL